MKGENIPPRAWWRGNPATGALTTVPPPGQRSSLAPTGDLAKGPRCLAACLHPNDTASAATDVTRSNN